MPIERAARNVLFGTPVVSHQIQKYMAQCKSCTVAQLREDFFDISKALFFSTIFNLTSRGVLERDGEQLIYKGNPQDIKGSGADRAWKAALMLGTFTSDKLAMVAELEQRYSTMLCKSWETDGYIIAVGYKQEHFAKFRVFRVAKPTQVRPRLRRGK